jgi:tetratricopeptide (TPR) repeat protein
MSKSKSTTIAVIGTVLVLLVFAWIYFENFDHQAGDETVGTKIESGITLFQGKKYAEALVIFEQIADDNPQKWRALYYQGSTQIMLKNYQSAVIYLEQALALEPTKTEVMNSLGVAYFKLGNLKMSKAYFASILEIEPDNMEAKGLMDIMANLERQQPADGKP